jgi:hypothetical protein
MKKILGIFAVLLLASSLVWAISFRNEKFLASDTSIAINTTAVDGVAFTSNQIGLAYTTYASITLFVQGGNAACSKDVIFKFAAYDSIRNRWDTLEYLSVSVTANGTNVVQKTIALTPDLEKIKLLSVQNQETIAGYTVTVNAKIFAKDQM